MTTLREWRAYREQSAAGPQGDLSMIALYSVDRPGTLEGLPGVWAPLAPGLPGLTLSAEAKDGITADGVIVDGTVTLSVDKMLVKLSDRLTAMATEQPGSDHLLEVWDSAAENLEGYEGISFYPEDPRWAIRGEFVSGGEGCTVGFAHQSDREGATRKHRSPGDIRIEVDGEPYVLTPFLSGDSLIVVFGDRTNGNETYEMGRMAIVTMEEGGVAVLDFNRAFLPPCAFSYAFNCPMPPRNNRLPFAVEAGEKQVLRKGIQYFPK
ncbi:DUF1684 domain-containing protein [Cohnella thailandensis]|uniref:DUF1684 domain-containing protein n=1 Tax=Cohnella thailandensis TaxID=557557 RepID=A0A841SM49_9BACL|nr:DUF1684 domain-containing protein [Cohnella thailandensis]MBB6633004.1 DUF1684 domain-containing protein [Cohnella thailandensis]MBP1975301.1 uncharacterized protein (DUF1684 family) [Cohnella thailandensis]